MEKFVGNWLLLIFVFFSIVCIYKKISSVLKKVSEMKSKSNGKQTNETPVSLLEVKVSLPTRVIFGDEALVGKYDPSVLAQIPKLRLGEGTLGTLYKAVLKCGSTVTIRKIRGEVANSDDFEFWIKFFGGVRDDSLLTLLFGFWYGGEAFVVHEYFCLGSLEELLHDIVNKIFMFGNGVFLCAPTGANSCADGSNSETSSPTEITVGTEGVQYTPLTWKIRQRIALGAAKAVAAIHSQVIENGKALVCGLIKASNILIRVDFSACLSSYETPYVIPPATIIRRNPGRIAPELTHNHNRPKVFTQKSDTYSFGVLLLELVTGKRASVTNLGEYIKEKKRREGLIGVPDKRMVDVNENVVAVIGIARLCLQNDPKERPSMDQVVQMIQELE